MRRQNPLLIESWERETMGLKRELDAVGQSWIGAPMIVEGERVGLVTLASNTPRQYDEYDAELIKALAHHAGVAISNARRYSRVEREAQEDELTGLLSRRHFYELAEREFDRTRDKQQPLSLLMIDIDHFKEVNDSYGHHIGDRVLSEVADRCKSALRDEDLLARYGGEEFTALLRGTELDMAREIAERLRRRVDEEPIQVEDEQISVTVTIGVTELSSDAEDFDAFVKNADVALYRAKRSGRNCVETEA